MKIRNGFVSNSSSSSFVVIFPTEPKSVEDVKKYLFDEGQEYFTHPYDDDAGFSVDQVSETVWYDICGQKKNKIKKAIKEFKSGSLDGDGAPDYNDFSHIKDWTEKWKAYDDANEKYAKKYANSFFNIRKLKLKKLNNEEITEAIYIFHYADEDGSYGSALEHGDLFRKLKHVRISKH